MKRRAIALLLTLCTLLLGGCGSLFDREYLSITDYEQPEQEPAEEAEDAGVSVKTLDDITLVLSGLIDERSSEGRIVFDPDYQGDVNADLASACWQIRTQDALCAYCVESISYDVSKIVSYYEAKITIHYTRAGNDPDSIVRLQLIPELEDELQEAIIRGDSQLVVLISRSSYTAEDVKNMASRVYRENPAAEPREPRVTVNMLSGTDAQRLYEINFNYSLSPDELSSRRKALAELAPFGRKELRSTDLPRNALTACSYLMENCSFSDNSPNDIYSALILGEANSEGLALAYVELCRKLNVPCQIVYGQRDWKSRCWNIIQLNGEYYHVDVAACISDGVTQGFLLPDETMWTRYRWDISSYPPCGGSLQYSDLITDPI